MADIPVEQTLVDRGHYGQQAAQVAQGQDATGAAVRASIAGANDAFIQATEYRFETNGMVAAVRVSETGSVFSVSNQDGSVRSEQSRTQGSRLQEVMATAFADGRISPQELASISTESQGIMSAPAVRGRRVGGGHDGPTGGR